MKWNSHKFVADGPGTGPVRSMSGISGLKMAILGSVRVGENFLKIFCSRDEKNNNMSGRSGIGVLVAGFSREGALKKHAPLVFSLLHWHASRDKTRPVYDCMWHVYVPVWLG